MTYGPDHAGENGGVLNRCRACGGNGFFLLSYPNQLPAVHGCLACNRTGIKS